MEGPPTFAVKIRRWDDSNDARFESEMAAKRDDYFAAGTRAAWVVDPAAATIVLYTATDPTNPTTFRKGDVAHAEPALPGWRLNVGDVFV